MSEIQAQIDIYLSFLHSLNITPRNSSSESLEELIELNFDLLDENCLKSLATSALKERDQNVQKGVDESSLFGSWGVVIDSVKTVLLNRRNLATNNFQQLILLGQQGDIHRVDELLTQIYTNRQADHLFMGILEETFNACRANGMDDNYYMLEHFKQFIDSLKTIKAFESLVLETKEKDTKAVVKAPTSSGSVTDKSIEAAGAYLQSLLAECSGDAKLLRDRVVDGIRSGKVDSSFDQALEDIIKLCSDAGYRNKVQLFEFVKKVIRDEREAIATPSTTFIPPPEDVNALPSTHHAPQFVSDTDDGKAGDIRVSCPESFIDASVAGINEKVKNTKKKSEKKSAKSKVVSLVDKIKEQLDDKGWAVCDDFLPTELVKGVKIESQLFRKFYEQSEIWVGKQADVGAHLSVPSVRGDKVLWMCGAHRGAPEGVSRAIQTIGEVEPCKLEVKATAPIRRFHAIKEAIAAVDKLIDELKIKVDKLKGVYERSDVMLANYPGEGARFARHIDNTTKDGRRLTVLVYLNPGWTADLGGALRLTHQDNPHEALDVLPLSGRIAMFYSSEIPHEVLPTQGDRHAFTIWYYDTEERLAAIQDAKNSGRAAKTSQSSIQSQQEAKAFIGDLMGGDEVGPDGGNPTAEELAELAVKVEKLSDEVVGIVSNITGAPSVQSFRDGFKLLVPEELKSMRKLFRKMGLQ